MPSTSEFARSYNSFSGIDIKAVFAGRAVGTLQGISYGVNREKAPIYTMGSADSRGTARGKRGIAGSMVFIQFDMDPLMHELANPQDPNSALYFQSDTDDLRPEYDLDSGTNVPVAGTSMVSANGQVGPGTAPSDQESDITSVSTDQSAAVPWYADQIPPFDICLAAANEYGALAIMKILAVEILNGGFGVSIDDLVCEHSYTFMARSLIPWTWQTPTEKFRRPAVRGGGVTS